MASGHRISVWLAAGTLLLAGAWVSGAAWRLGETYWSLRLNLNPFGDEGREWVFVQIGEHGGDAAYSFLQRSLEQLLERGGNDVELSGVIEGMAMTGDPRAEERLLTLFHRYDRKAAGEGRYIAVKAALGLRQLTGEDFSEPLHEESAYARFGVSNFSGSSEEQVEADERFSRLRSEIDRRFGRAEHR